MENTSYGLAEKGGDRISGFGAGTALTHRQTLANDYQENNPTVDVIYISYHSNANVVQATGSWIQCSKSIPGAETEKSDALVFSNIYFLSL